MDIWQAWIILGGILLILEMFTPALFLASLGLGCFSAAIVAYFGFNFMIQSLSFAVVSIVFIALVRPLVKNLLFNNSQSSTGIQKYIGQTANVIETINNSENKGRIKIFDEEWVARSFNEEIIEINEIVSIKKVEGLTLYVDKNGGKD